MTGDRALGAPGPFRPDELEGADGLRPDELAAESRVARDLEALASRSGVTPAGDFVARVMTAIATEPIPAPARAAGIALRRGAIVAFLASIRDAFDVALRPGFPMAARAQALALVLLVGGLAAGSGIATAGALGLLDGGPSVASPGPTVAAPASPAASPNPGSPQPAASEPPPSAGESAQPGEPSSLPEGSLRPGLTAEPEASEGDQADGSSASPTKKPGATRTPSPTPTDDHDDDEEEDDTPSPTRTPKPSETPRPTETPDSTDDPDD